MGSKDITPWFTPKQQDAMIDRNRAGNKGIGLGARMGLVLSAWTISLVTTWALAGLPAIAFIFCFPLGFLKYCHFDFSNNGSHTVILLVVWTLHIGWSILTVTFRNKTLFFIFFVLLLLLLALDVNGCLAIQHGFQKVGR
jgi:hypothetical protein